MAKGAVLNPGGMKVLWKRRREEETSSFIIQWSLTSRTIRWLVDWCLTSTTGAVSFCDIRFTLFDTTIRSCHVKFPSLTTIWNWDWTWLRFICVWACMCVVFFFCSYVVPPLLSSLCWYCVYTSGCEKVCVCVCVCVCVLVDECILVFVYVGTN